MNTYTDAQIAVLIAAKIDLNEFFANAAETAPATQIAETLALNTPVTPAKADGRNKAARAHNYEARIARRSATKTTAKGLTSGEKSDLYAALKETTQLAAPSKASWTRIVTAYKAAENTTGVSVAEFCAEWVVVNAAI